jgi:hypothetical protein
MKRNIRIYLAMLALVGSIVLPVNGSVKHLSSNRGLAVSAALKSGSPLPVPTPPAYSVATLSGSPLPVPTPPGRFILTASGSPLPVPTPPVYSALAASGSPLPVPTPPAYSVLTARALRFRCQPHRCK